MTPETLRSGGRVRIAGAALAAGLLLAGPQPAVGAAPSGWELVLAIERQVVRVFTPDSGALFAKEGTRLVRGEDGKTIAYLGDLLRSDDGGSTWSVVAPPPEAEILGVSPLDQQVLFAGGAGRLYRSDDGGASWRPLAERPERWLRVEVSRADPAVVYGVTLASPPTTNGRNSWHVFLVSRDGGATWEELRVHHETILPGTQPCAYGVRALQPHAADPRRVVTIEGCSGRGMQPIGGQSFDEGAHVAEFPRLGDGWAIRSIVGGRGTEPGRWYAAVGRADSAYSRVVQSQLARSDDDGLTWSVLQRSNSGEPRPETARPADLVGALAVAPLRPDELYATFVHYEPRVGGYGSVEPRPTVTTVRVSRDGGASWTDLGLLEGSPAGPPTVYELALGIDGANLYAATDWGLFRLALDAVEGGAAGTSAR